MKPPMIVQTMCEEKLKYVREEPTTINNNTPEPTEEPTRSKAQK